MHGGFTSYLHLFTDHFHDDFSSVVRINKSVNSHEIVCK